MILLALLLPAWATAQECVTLWESGRVRLDSRMSPQEVAMEWRLLYCPGLHYSATFRVPGRIKLEGRMEDGAWKEAVSETVPEGLQGLAPDRNAGGSTDGGYTCC